MALADTGMTTLLCRFMALREKRGAWEARSSPKSSVPSAGAAVLIGDVGGESGTTSAHNPPAGGVDAPDAGSCEREDEARWFAGRATVVGISALGLAGRTCAAMGRCSEVRWPAAPARDVSGLVGGDSHPALLPLARSLGDARLSLSLPLVQPASPSLARGASSSVTSCRRGLDRRMGEDDEVRERANAGRGGLSGPSSGDTAVLGVHSVDGSARGRCRVEGPANDADAEAAGVGEDSGVEGGNDLRCSVRGTLGRYGCGELAWNYSRGLNIAYAGYDKA